MERSPSERVVITGYGAVTAVGLNAPDTFQALIEGRSGIREMDPPEHKTINIAGQVVGFEPEKYFSRKEMQSVHRSAQFSTAAIAEGLMHAQLLDPNTDLTRDGIELEGVSPERIGAKVGSGVAGLCYVPEMQNTILKNGENKIYPRSNLLFLPERVITIPDKKFKFRGPTSSSIGACATGAINIGEAREILLSPRWGVDVMAAGATEAAIKQIGLASFAIMRALADPKKFNSPQEASTPFNLNAAGFVMGEGAGILILERLDHALKRNAPIHGEILGYGQTTDAFDDTKPSPHGEGVVRATRLALADAGLRPEDIDYWNAHGTSTPLNDPNEVEAILEIFGEHAYKMPISSIKSMIGHPLGAGGAIEAVICAMVIERGIIPPTINMTSSINKRLNFVPNTAQRANVRNTACASLGFGGLNTLLIQGRYI